MKSLLDKSFAYTPAASTDIRRLFRRVRKEQAEAAAKSNVAPLKKKVAQK